MRENWSYKKLGEVASYINGYAFKPEQWTTSGTPIVRIQNLNNPNAPFNYFSGEVPDKVKIKNGDLLISWSASLGAYIWQGGDAFLNQHIFKVDFNKLDIDKMFLKYAVTSKLNVMAGLVHGATMKHIVKKDFDNTFIPFPSRKEQELIVAELDKINELISLKKAQLSDLDALVQSLFSDMFGDPVLNEKGWEVKQLSEISSLISNGNTPKGGSEVYVDSGYLFLRSQNVWKNRIDLEDVAYIDDATHKKLKKSTLMHNDLLITKTGRFNTENSSLGRTALFEGEDGSANINGHVYLVRLKSGMIHKFVLYILISDSYRDLIRKTCVGGIDKRQLNKDHIEDFPIIFPPIELQSDYVKKVELIEKQKQKIGLIINDLETLLASRMQYWFG